MALVALGDDPEYCQTRLGDPQPDAPQQLGVDVVTDRAGPQHASTEPRSLEPVKPGFGMADAACQPGVTWSCRGTGPAMSSMSRAEQVPGAEAETPRQVPKRGWLQIAKRAWKEAKTDQVPLISAGVAFYAFLSIFPALIALVLLYGLVADPQQAKQQIDSFSAGMPPTARDLVVKQVEQLTSTSSSGLGIGLIISILAAMWGASNGTGHMITAINIAYDEDETRGFVKRKALALLLTLGAIVFVVLALALVALFPVVIKALGLPSAFQVIAQVIRWLGLVVVMAIALAVMYRWAPDRDAPKFRWASVGAVIATVLWVIASIGFSLYVGNFGSYGKTYGSLAGVVVLLMWLWITCYAVLLGAEANAEAEQQTARDTTKGPEQPMGQRGAVKADSPPGDVQTPPQPSRPG
jgi:membrane protein